VGSGPRAVEGGEVDAQRPTSPARRPTRNATRQMERGPWKRTEAAAYRSDSFLRTGIARRGRGGVRHRRRGARTQRRSEWRAVVDALSGDTER
jgi:hypothetical protein